MASPFFISRTTKLTLFILTYIISQVAFAESFWAHNTVKQVDIPYGEDAQQKMDIFRHGSRIGEPTYFKADPKARPTLVWIHGGGWLGGDKAGEIPQIIPYLERGWNVFNVNYRQGPNTAPAAVDDVMCAYKFVVEQLQQAGQPTDQIVVSGASAGGHLSLVVGLINSRGTHPCKTNTPPKAIVNWFGITDIEQVDEYLQSKDPKRNYARSWAGSTDKVEVVSSAYSPMYLISEDTPPIISIHGTNDTVVPYEQGESFHSSLSTPNELVTQTGGNHSGFTHLQYQDAYQKIFAFLKAH